MPMGSKFTRSRNAEYPDITEDGLENHGTELSQIPTYVTAVPNGTEKVGSQKKNHSYTLTLSYL